MLSWFKLTWLALMLYLCLSYVVGRCTNGNCVNGNCVQNVCECDDGWQGERCDQPFTPDDPVTCDDVQCGSESICEDVTPINRFRCKCMYGNAGTLCDSPAGDLTDFYVVPALTSNVERAGLLVDNNMTTCMYTWGSDSNPCFTVTLAQDYPVQHIVVYTWNYNGWSYYFRNANVTVDGTLCATHAASDYDSFKIDMYCPEGMTGREVKICKSEPWLVLCEVKIFGYRAYTEY